MKVTCLHNNSYFFIPKPAYSVNLERYQYQRKRTYKEYFFYSEGPKGRVLKVVRFALMNAYPKPYYNLVFGDWNEELKTIDDMSVTNNKDTEKVLATVAAIVLDFTEIIRTAPVYATGSSQARTRRYQIGINKFLQEIEEIFQVFGRTGNQLEPFQKNVNYDGFLVVRKEYLILEEPNEAYMTSSSKNNKKEQRVYNDQTIDGPELVDINKDPFVLKKMEIARKQLETTPITEEFLRKYGLM